MGGYLAFNSLGSCIFAFGKWYGNRYNTNNQAEMLALKQLLLQLKGMDLPDECKLIRVYGDSQLIVDFCNRKARPKE